MNVPDYASTRRFRAGFVAGLLLFLAANVHSYRVNPCFYEEGLCGFGLPFQCGYGFPFSAEPEGFPFESAIIWGGLVANCFIAVIASTLLGRLCNKLFRHRPAFK